MTALSEAPQIKRGSKYNFATELKKSAEGTGTSKEHVRLECCRPRHGWSTLLTWRSMGAGV